jgi:4-hydroxybenzoyl-CoA thioesterase
MPRSRIDLPERFDFALELPVQISHINAADHLDNVQMLTFVSEARERFLRTLGYLRHRVEGTLMVVAETVVPYRYEARYGDLIRVEMAVGTVEGKDCDLLFRLSDLTAGREVARGRNCMVCIDMQARRAVAIPEAFKARALAARPA